MLKYGVSESEILTIAKYKENLGGLSIFVLMRKLKCTPEKAAYIIKTYFPEEIDASVRN